MIKKRKERKKKRGYLREVI